MLLEGEVNPIHVITYRKSCTGYQIKKIGYNGGFYKILTTQNKTKQNKSFTSRVLLIKVTIEDNEFDGNLRYNEPDGRRK